MQGFGAERIEKTGQEKVHSDVSSRLADPGRRAPLTWLGPCYLHLSHADLPHRPSVDSPGSSIKTALPNRRTMQATYVILNCLVTTYRT